jgi:hypothetical protein
MALIICKDCKKEYSSDAPKCIHCGAKKPLTKIEFYGGGFCTIVFLLIFMAYIFSPPDSDQESASQAVSDASVPKNEERKPLNIETTTLALEKCIKQRLLFDDYITDISATPEDNLVKNCQPLFAMAVLACEEKCKLKTPAKCDITTCSMNLREGIRGLFLRANSGY